MKYLLSYNSAFMAEEEAIELGKIIGEMLDDKLWRAKALLDLYILRLE